MTEIEHRASRAAFADQASAVAAVIEAAGLGEGDAAALRACGFDVVARRFVAPDERRLRLLQASAGDALKDLGLRLACGAVR